MTDVLGLYLLDVAPVDSSSLNFITGSSHSGLAIRAEGLHCLLEDIIDARRIDFRNCL
jgi:hypothetical protein